MKTPTLSRKRTLAVFVGTALVASPFTLAGVAQAAPGTIKIAEVGSPVVNANDPKVCMFVIRAFGFKDSEGGNVSFAVNQEGDTNQPTQPFAAMGTFAINADGFGQSDPINVPAGTLPDGQFKAFVQDVDTPGQITNGGSKKKVFMIDCDDPGGNAEPPGEDSDDDDEDGDKKDRDKKKDKKKDKKDRDDGKPAVGGVRTGGGGNA